MTEIESQAGEEARASRILRAQPEARRQLEHPELMLFWRNDAAGRREGLLCQVNVCTTPECTCAGAKLSLFEVSDRLLEVELGEEEMLQKERPLQPAEAPPPQRKFSLAINFETGELSFGDSRPDEELVSWLRQELDGEVLDHLHRAWLLRKGISDTARLDNVASWEPGALIGFQEVFPESRVDGYLVSGRHFRAVDIHCSISRCSCNEAKVLFFEEATERVVHLGTVSVNLRTGRAKSFEEEEPNTRALLEQLWSLFCKRHQVVEFMARRLQRLEQHFPEIRRLHARSGTPILLARRPERNEPCPCGSGKKFKKCCAARSPTAMQIPLRRPG